jgi:hypothetical protein
MSMRIFYRFHGWLIFARVIALFMFVWPYVCPHILCMQLVICLLSHLIHIWFGHDLSMRILYRFHGWLIFARVIALSMFVWPYVRSHILCTPLVICLLSHFIHICYLDWPWSEHAYIIPISRMVDFCESYSPFHVCLTIHLSAHLMYATSHLSFVAFYSYLVSWLDMIWACAYYTDFMDVAHIIPISGLLNFARVIVLFMFVWPYVRSHTLFTQLVICLLSHFIHIWYLDWAWSEHAHIIPISRMVDFCESYSPFHVTIRAAAINYFLN